MKMFVAFASAAAVSLMAAPAIGQTIVNFDQSTDTASYASQGLVLNGFTILSDTFGGAVQVPSAPNYANVNATGSTITFRDPLSGLATTSNGFGLTIPGLANSGGYYAGATLTFLDTAGLTLGTQSFAPAGPSAARSPITYSNGLAGIAAVQFTREENAQGPALFPIDDVTFNLNAAPGGGAVPEPTTWAMMGLGFGLVGQAARRRRLRVRAVA